VLATASSDGSVRLWDVEQGAELRVLAEHGNDLETGTIVTVEPGRLRLRPPEHSSDQKPR